jgi:hypothetical protein
MEMEVKSEVKKGEAPFRVKTLRAWLDAFPLIPKSNHREF